MVVDDRSLKLAAFHAHPLYQRYLTFRQGPLAFAFDAKELFRDLEMQWINLLLSLLYWDLCA
jgi:hypothetical protein